MAVNERKRSKRRTGVMMVVLFSYTINTENTGNSEQWLLTKRFDAHMIKTVMYE